MNLSIPPNSISSITQRASPLHQPMKLFISSNGFQKISTVIQNILIKSISHSVNFTIPDLKPRTHTHTMRARAHALNLHASIPARIRDLFESIRIVPTAEVEERVPEMSYAWNLYTPANSYVKFNDGNRTAAKNTDTFDDDCNNCSNNCRNLYKTGAPIRANSDYTADLTAILIFPRICDIFNIFNIHGMEIVRISWNKGWIWNIRFDFFFFFYESEGNYID